MMRASQKLMLSHKYHGPSPTCCSPLFKVKQATKMIEMKGISLLEYPSQSQLVGLHHVVQWPVHNDHNIPDQTGSAESRWSHKRLLMPDDQQCEQQI